MLDTCNAANKALSASSVTSLPFQLKTNSRDQEFLTGGVLDSEVSVIKEDKILQNKSSSEEQIFQIASITKTFTAAALVKIASNEKYSTAFNQDDPMATPISEFESKLKPQAQEYFNKLKLNPEFHYSDITLRHLLNHNSGITYQSFFDEFRGDQTQSRHLSSSTTPTKTKKGFAEFEYSDANYNYLLAPIMEAVTGQEFSQIIKEQIIQPLNLQQTFMFDEMQYDSATNKVVVCERPETKVVQGYDYFQGKLTSGQDFNFDSAAGGIYSNTKEVSRFYKALLNGDLLSSKGNQIFFDSKNFIPSDEPSNANVKNSYGLGIRKAEGLGDYAGTEIFHHGGAALGFYSYVIGQRDAGTFQNVKVASAMLAYENLTRPIAAALLGDEKKRIEDGKFFVDEALVGKMNELAQNYTSEQLIEMRQELEKINAERLAMGREDTWVERIREGQRGGEVSSQR